MGCKKNKEQPSYTDTVTRENILNNNAHIVDTTSVTSVDISSLTLNKDKLSFTPTVGDIILASPSSNNPTGVFSKIVTVSTNGNTITCTTQPSNLNEAFKQLFLDYKYTPNNTQNAQLKAAYVMTFPFNYEITSGLVVNGNIQLNIPEVEIKYVKRDGFFLPDTFSILASANTYGSKITLETNGLINVTNEKTLYKYSKLPIIYVPIIVGGLPLIIAFWQNVEVKTLPLTISAKMKYTIYPEISASLGVEYINGDWINLCSGSIGAYAEKPIWTNFATSLDANLTFFTPIYNIGPLAFVKLTDTGISFGEESALHAFFKLPNTIEGAIRLSTPNYSIKYKLGIEAGVHYNFYLGVKGKESFNIPVYSKTIIEGNFGYNIGDTALGGIIAYIDPTSVYPNQHGFVCAMNDQATDVKFADPYPNPWPTFGSYGFGEDTAIGKGQANTSMIISNYGGSNIAATCSNYRGGGYSDWFLPSSGELKAIFKNRGKLPDFSTAVYWTSTAFGYSNIPYTVIVVDFPTIRSSEYFTQMNGWNNPPTANVRAIRKF